MVKRMLIDDTQPEETRVVIVDGNKVEDVEFESSSRKQLKGNIYTARVIRVEPSLQAAFIDYGGNRHGFLAFSEIHPDYYNLSAQKMEEIEHEVDTIIEKKKQYILQREAERARIRAEKKAKYEARKAEEERLKEYAMAGLPEQTQNSSNEAEPTLSEADAPQEEVKESLPQTEDEKKPVKSKRPYRRRAKKSANADEQNNSSEEGNTEPLKVLSARAKSNDDVIEDEAQPKSFDDAEIDEADDDIDFEFSPDTTEAEFERTFEIQRKLVRARKLYHSATIQDVIKEGQILLVQVVKEERGNKGASFTTYLSLAGRYGVLMPNRIKSGGVSRKITDAADRKRLKDIIKELPLSMDMSLIIRTAGEDKTREEILKDYNYLIRTWNLIRQGALKNKAPCLIYEEGDLIKRALRDMCTNDIAEIIVDGDDAFNAARNFIKILSPQNLRKLKCRKKNEPPVFQRYQIESQLDKLHSPNVQLESGGYLVINPTEALVAIDVNSGRATKEMDIEETALKTNLEAADEIARQLKMRDLAGLIVVDFIDMDDPKNNAAVEKRMKDALKNDRSRVQIAKMSCFGLLEISRQRMHSSFVESNYEPCPFCHGQGVMRTKESGAALILRAIEEEGIKNRFSALTIWLPSDTAAYLLNQKRQILTELEKRYNMSVMICADSNVKNVSDFRIERQRNTKTFEQTPETVPATAYAELFDEQSDENEPIETSEQTADEQSDRRYKRPFNRRRGRFDRRSKAYQNKRESAASFGAEQQDKQKSDLTTDESKGKRAWWRRLIG
ncbi:MAG: Rne/Rng family ribonuclease [Alphaproteobacteria bacterium]|nr:Rne/Rng family ribonuclease [Alphaproteobacteria bacterium]